MKGLAKVLQFSVPTFLRSELRFPQTAVAWPFDLVHLLRRCASLPDVVSRTMEGRTERLKVVFRVQLLLRLIKPPYLMVRMHYESFGHR